jgi:hypothetical protein
MLCCAACFSPLRSDQALVAVSPPLSTFFFVFASSPSDSGHFLVLVRMRVEVLASGRRMVFAFIGANRDSPERRSGRSKEVTDGAIL